MKFDPHIHSLYSGDSKSSIEGILKTSMEKKMDVIAISDHDTIKGSKKAIELSKKYKNIVVIPSIEITTTKGHILGLGVEELIEKNLSPEETIEKIHELNGLAIIPHPYTFYRHGLLTKVNYKDLKIDGLETKNGRYILGYGNYKASKLLKTSKIAGLGASDSHFLESIGDCYSEILINKDNDYDLENDNIIKEEILSAIKKNKVLAKGKGTSNILIFKEFINKKIKRKYKRN
ncbi:MAG: PHP domain-containing protein [Methanobrevibacter sp.]|jgi:predicted metal-dependent phosphoesterase TrpH|nr:PHP domain-containing protein [Methanobrevibacter sp.]